MAWRKERFHANEESLEFKPKEEMEEWRNKGKLTLGLGFRSVDFGQVVN